ncbi:hypothetical protein SALBM217S_07847 [Streptomyces griseoloalbus]
MLAAGFAVAAVAGVAACEGGSLGSTAVAITTDGTVTKELNRQKDKVRWLTCNASFGDRDGSSASPRSRATAASVDCEGETEGGKEITVTGRVRTPPSTMPRVRGDITAQGVDGRQRSTLRDWATAISEARPAWANRRRAAVRGPPSP